MKNSVMFRIRKGFYSLLKEKYSSMGWGFFLLLLFLQILHFKSWCKKSCWRISQEWWQLTIIEALFVVNVSIALIHRGGWKESSGIHCTEHNCELWNRIFHMSSSLSRHLFILFFISIAHRFTFSQAKTKYWLSLHVFHLAVFSAEWCCEERCWVGIRGTLRGGVQGLYLVYEEQLPVWLLFIYIRKIQIVLCISLWKLIFQMNKKYWTA